MTGKVIELTPANYRLWDQYVDHHLAGTFYHLSGWKELIESVYDHKCIFLYWFQEGKICGILPLVEQKSWLFGHALISTPICVLGGVVADSPEVENELILHAKQFATKLKVDYLELRSPAKSSSSEPESTKASAGLVEHQGHVMFGCELADSDEKILASIKKKQRAVIRQSLSNGLVARVEPTIDNLYHIYSTSVRNLGTPVFPKKSFSELKRIFGSRCEVFTVFDQTQPVSSVMSFYYKGQVLPHYGGGISRARALKSNDFMYYKLMCHAKDRGCHYFDFGRSKIDSGAYRYKKHWGMNIRPMSYKYYLVKSKSLPSLSANNPKYQFFIKLWKKLPLVVSQQLGPVLAKHLG